MHQLCCQFECTPFSYHFLVLKFHLQLMRWTKLVSFLSLWSFLEWYLCLSCKLFLHVYFSSYSFYNMSCIYKSKNWILILKRREFGGCFWLLIYWLWSLDLQSYGDHKERFSFGGKFWDNKPTYRLYINISYHIIIYCFILCYIILMFVMIRLNQFYACIC